jgi:hypothetical protein
VSGAAPRRQLQAGPLSLELDDGGLRYIRLGDREVLRRVYVAVRDDRWVTIPMAITALDVMESEGSFSVELVAEHRLGAAHFHWRGHIAGDARGTIRYEMDGEVLAPFSRNRVGICVLHPIDECAGRPCRLGKPDGTIVESRFPRLISPHQPFLDVRALSHEVEPGLVAEVCFEGDVFETEDQRNWSDFSYKTYSTPQALPKPVRLEAGTRIRQAIVLRLVPAAVARSAPPPRPAEIVFSLGEGAPAPLPRLGTTLAPRPEPLTETERRRLGALHLSHLRVELVPSREDFAAALGRAAEESRALALPLEVALWLDDADRELAQVAAALGQERPSLSTVLVLPLARGASALPALARARELLPSVPLAAGSNVHFTELNRDRAGVAGADLLLFPSSPQVHMTDDATVVENLGSLWWLGETARSFSDARPLGMSPVFLRPPPCPPPALGGEDLSTLPRHVDPRQAGLLCAAWTACHVGRAARAGLAQVTYHQSVGWRGLMYGEKALPADFAGEPGAVFPVYHALADIGEMAVAGGVVLPARSSVPLAVDGLLLRAAGRTRLLLANFTRVPQTVRLPPELAGPTRRLGPASLSLATRDPEAFRAAPPEPPTSIVSLGPQEIVRVDSGA